MLPSDAFNALQLHFDALSGFQLCEQNIGLARSNRLVLKKGKLAALRDPFYLARIDVLHVFLL